MGYTRHVDLTNSEIGNYHFRSKLGGGGFADVYLADEVTSHRKRLRQVAIKVFPPTNHNDRRSLQETHDSFSRDLQFLAKLSKQSPIILYYTALIEDVAVLQAGEVVTLSRLPSADISEELEVFSVFMIVMEYADGGSLDGKYRDEVILRDQNNDYLSHFKDVCVALKSAHDEGIIHRDVKPANLFWFKDSNNVKLGDFGIAKDLRDSTTFGPSYIAGTLPYLAPEIFRGAGHTPASDIYALGCTLYELYTGMRAFDPAASSDIHFSDDDDHIEKYRRLHNEAIRPDAITATQLLSIRLNGVIKKMMAINPGERPTISSVIEALELEQASQTVIAAEVLSNIDASILPTSPEFKSRFIVNPDFRLNSLGELVYFLFVDVQPRTEENLRRLFKLLREHFGDSYSIWEVFGDHAFLIRLWSQSERRLSKFIDNIKQFVVGDNDNGSIRLIACEDVFYLNINNVAPSSAIDKTKALIALDEVQRYESKEDEKWLKVNGVYCGSPIGARKKRAVKAFCFAKTTSHQVGDEADREVQSAVLRDAIKQSGIDSAKLEVALYRKAYLPIRGVPNLQSDHIISYVAPNYDEVIRIPELIMDRVTKYRFRTNTILTTGRFYVESDQVYCGR